MQWRSLAIAREPAMNTRPKDDYGHDEKRNDQPLEKSRLISARQPWNTGTIANHDSTPGPSPMLAPAPAPPDFFYIFFLKKAILVLVIEKVQLSISGDKKALSRYLW